jgi:ArsR family transcriptional regulator
MESIQLKRLTDREVQHIAAALAAPRRCKILKEVGTSEHPYPCTALVEANDISPATVSHHIKELERAGLVEVTRAGKYMNVLLKRDVLRAYAEHLTGF